jgi:hypothetical protein
MTASLITLFLGWWGIPFGLICTPFFLIRNLLGGEKTTVGELIERIEDPARYKKGLLNSEVTPLKAIVVIAVGLALVALLIRLLVLFFGHPTH